jgi:hypothetical protein
LTPTDQILAIPVYNYRALIQIRLTPIRPESGLVKSAKWSQL